MALPQRSDSTELEQDGNDRVIQSLDKAPTAQICCLVAGRIHCQLYGLPAPVR